MRKTSVHQWPRGTRRKLGVRAPLCVGSRARGPRLCARVCIDCSQLLNINLKVKGRELFDIHAGSVPCTRCWSPTHAAAPSRSLWVIMSATVSPLPPLMCCHSIEPERLCAHVCVCVCVCGHKTCAAFHRTRR